MNQPTLRSDLEAKLILINLSLKGRRMSFQCMELVHIIDNDDIFYYMLNLAKDSNH